MFRLGFHKGEQPASPRVQLPPRSSQERHTGLRLHIFQSQDRFLPRRRGRRPTGAPPLVHVSSRGFSVAHIQIYLVQPSRELVCSLGLISWTDNRTKHENKKIKTWFISTVPNLDFLEKDSYFCQSLVFFCSRSDTFMDPGPKLEI